MLKADADVEVYKERLLELRKRVKRDIYAWTKSFVNEFQRQPNKQERKDVAGAMFKAYSGVRAILITLPLFYPAFACLFCKVYLTYLSLYFCPFPQSQKILKDLGVDIVGESSKLPRGTSVKFAGADE